MRHDGREPDELRRVELQPGFTTNPAGSVLIRSGKTMVLCTASIVDRLPRWRKDGTGWMTAEYAMAPGSTPDRTRRESQNRVKGRTQEIQRLIGRSLRAGVDLSGFGDHTVHIDCEVLQADGGTRTASITGGWVAMALAADGLLREGAIERSPIQTVISAVSCGVVDGTCLLDLDYPEDSQADVDLNLVVTGSCDIVEVQATGEGGVLAREQLDALVDLGVDGCGSLRTLQLEALGSEAVARLGLGTP